MSENPDQNREYRKRRAERRRRYLRRRRRNRIIIVIIVLLLIVAAATVTFAIAKNKSKSGSQSDASVTSGLSRSGDLSGSAKSSEASSSGNSASKGSSDASSSDTSASKTAEKATAGFKSDGSFCDNSTEWTYKSSASMPTGDIVSTDKAAVSYDTMRDDLYLLQKRYPSYVTIRNFGTSLDKRELLEAVIGSGDADKDIIIQYSMHAREYIETLLGLKQLENILANYETGTYENQTYSTIFSKIRIHIIPMMNPDGVMISQEGIDAINDATLKENLMSVYQSDLKLGKGSQDINEYWVTWKANARSVDLNRNFATDGWTTSMGTQQPSCSRYPGTGPNSEPEVKALIALNDSMHTVCEIAYHCHGRLVYWDYGMESVDEELYKTDDKLAQLITSLTAVDGHDGYEQISTVKDGQNPGGCSDYFMQVEKIPAITIETGRKFKDDGSYNEAPLSIDEFALMWDENIHVLPAIAVMFSSQ